MSSASTAHNQALRKEVEDLEERGWDVDADHLSGYDRPAKIESTTQDRIPDIEATKKGGRRIVEIKRQKNSWKIRSDQVKTFNRSVNRRKNTRFYGRLIDEERKSSLSEIPREAYLILAIGREYFVKREIWSVTAGTFRQTSKDLSLRGLLRSEENGRTRRTSTPRSMATRG
jgi:hypothetical protein